MKLKNPLWAAVAVSCLVAGCGSDSDPVTTDDVSTEPQSLAGSWETEAHQLAEGSVTAISETDDEGNPKMIGFKFVTAMLDDLPTELNREAAWFDINGNGEIDVDMMATPPLMEIHGDYKTRFTPPGGLGDNPDCPFQFLEINWNPMGHPPEPWSVPHMDFHFYISSREEVDAIELGPHDFLISDKDFARATAPVDPKYFGEGYIDVGAAVGQMGNHLVDPTSPELAPGGPPFTYTWIFGCFDGEITFWEPMITREFIKKREEIVVPIKLPEAYAIAGYYPTVYAVRHLDDGTSTVTIEDFVYREAS